MLKKPGKGSLLTGAFVLLAGLFLSLLIVQKQENEDLKSELQEKSTHLDWYENRVYELEQRLAPIVDEEVAKAEKAKDNLARGIYDEATMDWVFEDLAWSQNQLLTFGREFNSEGALSHYLTTVLDPLYSLTVAAEAGAVSRDVVLTQFERTENILADLGLVGGSLGEHNKIMKRFRELQTRVQEL